MDDAFYKLIFEGETLPGFKEKHVRKNLKELLNADKEKLNRLFSGKPVVVRKNLTADQIRPYERAMMKAGASCRILSTNGDEELAPTPQEAILEENQPQVSRPSKSSRKFQPIPRMGRVRFTASLWIVSLLGVAAWWLPERLTPHLITYYPPLESLYITLGLIAFASLLMLLITARRLHDIDSSGWRSLFLIIPGINLLVILWLALSSGTKNTNRFGAVPAPAGTIAQLFGLWIPLLVIIASGTYGWLHQEELQQLAANLPEMIGQLDIPLLNQDS
ncbi:DUF805 domain-containing protein [Endozoicomonas sp.]|uniref:DUF805 domain-containing protein n=1 Tax=Endozoicomonas sp. TaxID=1892382 RepID=UPI003AF44954